MTNTQKNQQAGQALVVLLIFVTVATMVGLTSTLLTAYTIASASRAELQQSALDNAESGLENGLMRFLRDPSYSGETLTLADGSATLTITGSTTKTFTSVGKSGNFTRTVVVTGTYTNGILSITSWKDSF